ncbi:MAG: T9SS type A sorting domain-containing protein [Bacteroidetes bacterium]|nr:T9SS type A sorting domain-containing protein [Bacteroidota bacterium]
MFDLSGTVSYSKTLSVHPDETGNRIEVYPTISEGTFYIKSSERITNTKINLFDMNGKLVAEKKPGTLNAGTTVPLTFPNIITKGVFVLRVYKDEVPISTQKVIITQ